MDYNNENGYVLTANPDTKDVYAQKVDYNEHRFTQKWVIEKKGDSYYIWLKDTNKAISQYTGFMFISGTGISLDEGWLDDEGIGYNVIWNIKPEQ